MIELAWQEINNKDQLVIKRKSFKNQQALEKFIAKLEAKDSFYGILAIA